MASVSDSVYVFDKVNDFLRESGQPPMFKIQLLGFSDEVKLNTGLFSIKPDAGFESVKKTDLVIIPALHGHINSATYISKDCAPWIATQYKNGAEIASLCTGTFLLAYSGILNGKECTTHWAYADEFRYFYPAIRLVDQKVITDQDGLYSSGGGTAYWNLLIHLVEKYTNREMAIRTAKYFMVDYNKTFQSPFIVFKGLKDHNDDSILKAQEIIEQLYPEKLTVEEIAEKLHLTRRTFERRFKKATRHTVAEYIQKVRVEAAKKQLEIGRSSIHEVMYKVGYMDVQAFRDIFKRLCGMTPVEYKKKYNF